MNKPTYPLSAIAILLDFYARCILVTPWGGLDRTGQQIKKPLRRDWQRLSPTFLEVKQHIDQGGLLGVVPASLGKTVLDVDRGDPIPLLACHTPWAVCPSLRPGRLHLWYTDSQPRPATPWRYAEGGAGGELISQHPYVILWGESLQALADALTEGDLPGQAHFDQVAPALTFTADQGKGRSSGPSGRNRRPTIYHNFRELAFVNPGERNDALYDVLGVWARDQLRRGNYATRAEFAKGAEAQAQAGRREFPDLDDFPESEASAIASSVANYWPGTHRGPGHGENKGGAGQRSGGLGDQGYRGDPALNSDSDVQRYRRGRRTALDAVRTGHRQTQVAARYRLGAELPDLSTAFGCTQRTIWRDLAAAELPSRRRARRLLQADGERRRRKRAAATAEGLHARGEETSRAGTGGTGRQDRVNPQEGTTPRPGIDSDALKRSPPDIGLASQTQATGPPAASGPDPPPCPGRSSGPEEPIPEGTAAQDDAQDGHRWVACAMRSQGRQVHFHVCSACGAYQLS